MALLIWTRRKEMGFYVAASGLILYAGFLPVDISDAGRENWTAIAIWIAFCATGILAARLLRNAPKSRMSRPEAR
jgi:hypothetical protein